MQNSQGNLDPREPRSIMLPLRTLILGSNLILVLGLVLGVSLWPYFLQSLSRITGLEKGTITRSEEHTSELQSRSDLVCRLLLEKKKNRLQTIRTHLSCR